MNQHVPVVSEGDVERVIRRDFPGSSFEEISAVIGRYGAESFHSEMARVRLAVLKLAAGDYERLGIQTAHALSDPRDVVAAAEYPNYWREADGDWSGEEEQEIIRLDRDQYERWLHKS
ncbi:MAG: hypothetical protein JWO82_2782 [Akkermansiaceae bacterium]|nr:hypothetical protein [Akkermansiaceae bacterium]